MRLSGVLMPIDSLPNNWGVSTLSDAVRFVRFLKKAEQSYWQITPVSAVHYEDGEVSGVCSVFGWDISLIDTDKLSDTVATIDTKSKQPSTHQRRFVEWNVREQALLAAFESFYRETPPQKYNQFVIDNKYWLDDFALFVALKHHFKGLPWYNWPEDIRNRQDEAILRYSELLSKNIEYHKFCQYTFYCQWQDMRTVLKDNGIKLIGETELLVEYDSADVWAHRQLFALKPNGQPRRKLRIKDKKISDQRSIYIPFNWQAMRMDGYNWFRQRIAQCAAMYDSIIIDHFETLSACFAINADKADSWRGIWLKGAGKAVVDVWRQEAPELQLAAGFCFSTKKSLVNFAPSCGVATCRSIQQVVRSAKRNTMFNINKDCYAYVCTDIKDSAYKWWIRSSWITRRKLRKVLNLNMQADVNWQMLSLLAVTDAQVAVVAMQDLIQWGYNRHNDSPMFCDSDFSNNTAKRLAELTQKAYRSPQPKDSGC